MRSDHAMVFKIVNKDDWTDACAREKFMGSIDDHRDGFIHLSGRHQVEGTLKRHYSGKRNLLLVAFSAGQLGGKLKWEPSRGGEDFPHLYAELPTKLAIWTRDLELDQDGNPKLPPDF